MRAAATSCTEHGGEELPHVRGQGQRPRVPGCDGAGMAERSYPRPRSGVVVRRFPSSTVRSRGVLCWNSHEKIPHIQGKRNPSKTVGVARGHQRADTLKPYSHKTSHSNHTRTTALSNSVKLSHTRGATQDGGSWWRGLTECGSLEKGMANQSSCLENPMNSMKKQNDRILKEELPRCPICYWRSVEK